MHGSFSLLLQWNLWSCCSSPAGMSSPAQKTHPLPVRETHTETKVISKWSHDWKYNAVIVCYKLVMQKPHLYSRDKDLISWLHHVFKESSKHLLGILSPHTQLKWEIRKHKYCWSLFYGVAINIMFVFVSSVPCFGSIIVSLYVPQIHADWASFSHFYFHIEVFNS